MRRGIGVVAALASLLAGAGSAAAQVEVEPGPEGRSAIAGRILDATTGAPIPGAQVSVPGTGAGMVAGSDGGFRVEVPAGDQVLRVERLGYGTVEAAVRVPADAAVRTTVRLSPEPVEAEAVEAEVETERSLEERRRATTIRRMTAEEIAEYPNMELAELIERFVPGARVVRNAQTGCPYIETGRRAYTRYPDRLTQLRSGLPMVGDVQPLIVLDGVPSNDTCTLDLIDEDDIEEIEYRPESAAGPRWANRARGGVLIVTTKSGRRSGYGFGPGGSGISINPYIGYYHFDQSSFEEAIRNFDVGGGSLFGVRVGIGGYEGFAGSVAYARAGVELSGEEEVAIPQQEPRRFSEDAAVHLLYAALEWHLPLPGPLDVFLAGGAGAIKIAPEERDGATDVLVNFGAGASLPIGPARIRVDVKDHVDLCSAPDTFDEAGACLDDETLHNIELSAGVALFW